ncbi:hypothetical protein CRV07_00135 [Halarcobacter ebronensis]|uniref:TPM domain-containing protein n=2 Tax=Halarcobacter ebronensis TaxID=1462615 RepID=A0A4Q1AZX4_9BACT|nr:hypothetical protein CRV07_00135 [Halarcobacter ebronensis]
MVMLTKKEKKQISQKIKKVEDRSSAELVAVIARSSSSYLFYIITFSLFIAIIATIIAMPFNPNAIKLFQIEFLSFFASFFLLSRFKTPILYLLPKEYKYKIASKKAHEEFIKLGLDRTETKEAIMFFVSVEEKFVQIITDKNIKEKIEDNYWQNIVDEFILDVKNRDFSKGYMKAIDSCSKLLIKEFPIQKDDKNELSNEVIEL